MLVIELNDRDDFMSKKKKHTNDIPYKTEDEMKYSSVLLALNYLFKKQDEEEKRELARIKTKRVIGWLTLIGLTVLIALSLISDYSFDVSWMADAKKWYSDIYVSFMAYIIITDIVLILEKQFKVDQKPVFGYIWPFIGFALTLFFTNTIDVDFIPGELRFKISLFIIFLIPASLMMISSYKTGKEIAQQRKEELNKVEEIINNNPEIVKDIMSDYNKYLNEMKENKDKK